MATTFQTIVDLVRPLINDTDSDAYVYSVDIINGHIKATFLTVDNTLTFTGTSFDQELDFKTQIAIAIKTAKSVVAMAYKEFVHKSPILSVTRKWDKATMLAELDSLEREISGTRGLISSVDEYDKLLNLYENHINKISQV